MSVCSFESINNLTLESAKKSLRTYCQNGVSGLIQYDKYYRTSRETAKADIRILALLELVRYGGWNMNRNGQCAHIIHEIKTGSISIDELERFWEVVDSLPNITLRDLPNTSREDIKQIELSFDVIRKKLRGWHSSADSLCFLTKVILMFNWGQAPAFDTRIREVLKVRNNLTSKDLIIALTEIGAWIRSFESKYDVRLDKLATEEMYMHANTNALNPLPLGRSFDMLVYFNNGKLKGSI